MANIYVGDSYGCLSDLPFSWENLHCSFFLELVQTFLDNQLQPNQSPLLVPRGPWLYLERTYCTGDMDPDPLQGHSIILPILERQLAKTY